MTHQEILDSALSTLQQAMTDVQTLPPEDAVRVLRVELNNVWLFLRDAEDSLGHPTTE